MIFTFPIFVDLQYVLKCIPCKISYVYMTIFVCFVEQGEKSKTALFSADFHFSDNEADGFKDNVMESLASLRNVCPLMFSWNTSNG